MAKQRGKALRDGEPKPQSIGARAIQLDRTTTRRFTPPSAGSAGAKRSRHVSRIASSSASPGVTRTGELIALARSVRSASKLSPFRRSVVGSTPMRNQRTGPRSRST